VICEGSCDTEDWSNDAEDHRNKLHFTIYSQTDDLHWNNILLFFLYVD